MTGPPEEPSVRSARAVRDAVDARRRAAHRVATDAVGRVRRRVPEGTVALTFDDGPHPGPTDAVLDVLARLEVTATFFCVGENASRHPQLVRRMRAEGHAVGSHSQTHPHPRSTPLASLDQEYQRGRASVSGALGERTRLFRPPHGHLGARSALLVRRSDLDTWLWTVDPEDWRPGVTRDDVVAVAGRASSTDVVLLHDWVEQPVAAEALDRSATVDALPGIVSAVRGRGLRFTRLQP